MLRALTTLAAAASCLLLLLPVVLWVAATVLFAGCARAIGRVAERRFVPWGDLMTYDATLGWRPRPHLDTCYLATNDDVFRIVTDAEGWPGRRSLDGCSTLVLGDSFAFGYGVDTSRSFAEVDGRLRLKAIGAPGYSMVQSVLLMEQLGSRMRGKLIVWFVYPENDLQDNLAPEMRSYRAPFVRPDRAGGWEIVAHHVNPTAWDCSNLDQRRLFPQLCVPGPLADRAYSACEYLIARAQRACTSEGATLVLLTIPNPIELTPAGIAHLRARSGRADECDETMPDRRLVAACSANHVPMVTGKDHFSVRDYKRREGIHWNERGHRRVAQVLRRIVESHETGTLEARVSSAHRLAGRGTAWSPGACLERRTGPVANS